MLDLFASLSQIINLPQVINLPQDIKSKILTYYLSYGSPSAIAIRPEIINKCRNNSVSIWFANIDYCTFTNKKYMLNKSIGCPFEVLCELRLALIANNILNGTADKHLKSRRIILTDHINLIKKNTLLKLIDEEAEILLY
jgi:hypothetical protein